MGDAAAQARWFARKMQDPEFREKRRLQAKENYAKNKNSLREKSLEYYYENHETRKEKLRMYQKQNPELRQLRKDKRTAKLYGITLEELYALRKTKNCEICNSELTGSKKLHLDHCHRSGKLRGVLCNNCNHMLGQAMDSVEILKQAIKYLEKEPAHETHA